MSTAARHAAAILVLATLAGLGLGWLRGTLTYEPKVRVRHVVSATAAAPPARPREAPPRPPVPELSVPEAKALISAGAIIIDARRPEDFALGHLPGALNLPVEEFEACLPEVEPRLSPRMPLLVYCGGGDCTLSHELADILRQMGYARVEVLAGGLEAWKAAGLGVDR